MSILSLLGFSRIPSEFIENSQETFDNNFKDEDAVIETETT
jgi:hypothetical protein